MGYNKTDYTVAVSNITAPLAAASNPPTKPILPRPAYTPPAKPALPQPELSIAEPENPAPRLSLLDLLLTVIAVLCALLVLLRRGRTEEYSEDRRERRRWAARFVLPSLLTALAAIVLFFATQPLVWRFRLVDWWTILFVVIAALSVWLMLRRRGRNEEGSKYIETWEELE